jgi:hypothetical protein
MLEALWKVRTNVNVRAALYEVPTLAAVMARLVSTTHGLEATGHHDDYQQPYDEAYRQIEYTRTLLVRVLCGADSDPSQKKFERELGDVLSDAAPFLVYVASYAPRRMELANWAARVVARIPENYAVTVSVCDAIPRLTEALAARRLDEASFILLTRHASAAARHELYARLLGPQTDWRSLGLRRSVRNAAALLLPEALEIVDGVLRNGSRPQQKAILDLLAAYSDVLRVMDPTGVVSNRLSSTQKSALVESLSAFGATTDHELRTLTRKAKTLLS